MARKTARAKPRLTQKQDAFALAYLETGNAAEAYRRAFNVADADASSWIYVEASKLLRHPKIAQRLERLRLEVENLVVYNICSALFEYEDARLLAMNEGSPGAAVAAIKGKVRLFGLDAPKRESFVTEIKQPEKMITDEMTLQEAADAWAATRLNH